jgi:hypothetical protein
LVVKSFLKESDHAFTEKKDLHFQEEDAAFPRSPHPAAALQLPQVQRNAPAAPCLPQLRFLQGETGAA